MPLDGQQISNVIDRVIKLLPTADTDRIAEIIYRAIARQIGHKSNGCYPGFRVIEKEVSYDPDMTYFRLIYVHNDGSSRTMGMIVVPSEYADELAGHYGSCECHAQ